MLSVVTTLSFTAAVFLLKGPELPGLSNAARPPLCSLTFASPGAWVSQAQKDPASGWRPDPSCREGPGACFGSDAPLPPAACGGPRFVPTLAMRTSIPWPRRSLSVGFVHRLPLRPVTNWWGVISCSANILFPANFGPVALVRADGFDSIIHCPSSAVIPLRGRVPPTPRLKTYLFLSVWTRHIDIETHFGLTSSRICPFSGALPPLPSERAVLSLSGTEKQRRLIAGVPRAGLGLGGFSKGPEPTRCEQGLCLVSGASGGLAFLQWHRGGTSHLPSEAEAGAKEHTCGGEQAPSCPLKEGPGSVPGSPDSNRRWQMTRDFNICLSTDLSIM